MDVKVVPLKDGLIFLIRYYKSFKLKRIRKRSVFESLGAVCCSGLSLKIEIVAKYKTQLIY